MDHCHHRVQVGPHQLFGFLRMLLEMCQRPLHGRRQIAERGKVAIMRMLHLMLRHKCSIGL